VGTLPLNFCQSPSVAALSVLVLSFAVIFQSFLPAYQISIDFMEAREGPPTATRLQNVFNQSFPGLVFCNFDPNAEIIPLFGFYEDEGMIYDFDDTTFRYPMCDGVPVNQCIIIDNVFPAFGTTFDSDGNELCSYQNGVFGAINVNSLEYNTSTIFLGAEVLVFGAGQSSGVERAICSGEGRCQTLADDYETCSQDVSDLSFDWCVVPFFYEKTNRFTNPILQARACIPSSQSPLILRPLLFYPFVRFHLSAGTGTFVSLSRSEIQHTPNCPHPIVSWNPVVTPMSFNDGYFASFNFSEFQSDSLAVYITFDTPKVTYVLPC